MKHAETLKTFAIVLVFVAISLNVGSLYNRISHSDAEILHILIWVLIGVLAGAILCTFWLWRMMRLSFKNVLACTSMISLIFFGWGFVDFQNTRERSILEAEKWPQIQATISAIDIYEAPPTKTRRPTGRWAPVWNYQYSIGNESFQSFSMSAPFIHALDFQQSPDAAKARGKERPEGSTLSVRYNPKKPDESVIDLRPVDGTESKLFISLGMILMLIGSVGLYVVEKRTRQK